MSRNIVVIPVLTIFLVSLFGINVNAGSEIKRLYGQTRYETCQEVSKNGWVTSENVIVANGENYPDALGAAALSNKYKAPILLVHGSTLQDNPVLASELKRLKAKNVIVLGGVGVVSKNIEDSLKKNGYKLQRLAGEDRYTTSVKIAEKLGQVDEIFIANADDFAAALSSAPISGVSNIPILLVSKEKLPSSVESYIKDKKIKTTYVLGDSSLIAEEIASKLPNVKRIPGNSRYSINKNIINNFKTKINFSTVYIASGEGFADTLSAVGLSVKNGNPIILASSTNGAEIKQLLSGKDSTNKVVLGGEGVLPNKVISSIVQQNSLSRGGKVEVYPTNDKKSLLLGSVEKSGEFACVDGNWQYTSKEAKEENIEVISVKVWDYIDANDKSKGKHTVSKTLEVNKKLSAQVKQIFDDIYNLPEKFPIKDVGCFREKDSIINHPAGAAIDINPDENYYIKLDKDGKVVMQVGNYYKPKEDPYSITPEVVKVFQKYGWDWGGNFNSLKDYMHFSYLGG